MKKITPGPRHSNHADNAFARLERLLITLELAPGADVTESELAEYTNMGRTPVREAIQRLAWIGLITIRPRKGLRVASLCPSDYKKILRVRMALEPMLASEAARMATDALHDRIADCRDLMEDADRRRDVKLYLSADKEFDRVFGDAAGNPFLSRALDPLQCHARRHWYFNTSGLGIGDGASLHIDIMNAVINRDAPGAEAAMARLLQSMMSLADVKDRI